MEKLLTVVLGSIGHRRFRLTGRGALVLLSASLIGYALVLRPVLAATAGQTLGLRIAVSILAVMPIGSLMGIPFPWALEILAPSSTAVTFALVVNAFAALLGVSIVEPVAIRVGYTAVLAVAAAGYGLALWSLTLRAAAPRRAAERRLEPSGS